MRAIPGLIGGLIVLLLAFMLLHFIIPAIAQETHWNKDGLPEAIGHPEDHMEFFDTECCNGQDCEVVPDSAITETKDGWKILYYTHNYGGMVVSGFVPRGQEHMSKRCDDHGNCTGVCAKPNYITNERCGQYGCDYDYSKPATPHCLYLRPTS